MQFSDADVARCASGLKSVRTEEMGCSTLVVPVVNPSGTLIAVLKCEGKYSQGHMNSGFSGADQRLVEIVASMLGGSQEADVEKISVPA